MCRLLLPNIVSVVSVPFFSLIVYENAWLAPQRHNITLSAAHSRAWIAIAPHPYRGVDKTLFPSTGAPWVLRWCLLNPELVPLVPLGPALVPGRPCACACASWALLLDLWGLALVPLGPCAGASCASWVLRLCLVGSALV